MQLSPREQAEQAGQKLHHFHGGLKLKHNKKISCSVAVRRSALPPRLFVPLLQHAGEQAVPLVASGQTILKGDPIGRYEFPATGFVHAPTSGIVTAIAKHLISHPSGQEGLAVVIKPDGRDRWCELTPLKDWEEYDAETICQRLAEAGIVGLGGAVYPTSSKLGDAQRKSIHTLILNGAECEPYISCDEMLMREHADRVVLGARVLQRASGAGKTIIAVEDQMGEVWEKLQAAVIKAALETVQLVKVTTIYPEGGEKQLIQVLTGLEVPAGQRPSDLGLLCQNVATATAAADAVIDGKPLIERIVTVTGSGVREPANLLALFGTPVSNLVEDCGGYSADAARLIIGGPMMGYALASDANPLVKAANCLLILSQKDLTGGQTELPCIRCGECSRVCPSTLLPQQLQWDVRNGLIDDAADHGLQACIECGCCDFVCPSHIPLTQWFRFGKSEFRRMRDEREKSQHARERHEAREQRLEVIKQSRVQRMEEKKKGLQDDEARKAKIAAAMSRVQKRNDSAESRPENNPSKEDST